MLKTSAFEENLRARVGEANLHAASAGDAVSAGGAGRDVILVRPFTEADDVAGFHAAKGILTSEGGKASHAALVARGMGVPAVTGAHVAIDLEASELTIDGRTFKAGEQIAIDGSEGTVVEPGARLIEPEIDERFDTVVLDPPAFAKSKQSLVRALAGYKEINLRAMRLLAPGGVLFTCSCSYHVSRSVFLEMVADAARDSGTHLELLAVTGAGRDHPEIVNVPETGYLKGALVRAAD